MKLICFWCLVTAVVNAQYDEFYAPQTYKVTQDRQLFMPNSPWNHQNDPQNHRQLFTQARSDVGFRGASDLKWRQSAPVREPWRDQNSGAGNVIQKTESWDSGAVNAIPKSEPWSKPYGINKEQQAAILHHKQSLSSDGAFRFEYASDNGVAAGEKIEPDGSRVGAYQYKDPNGQLVTLKYRAGKDGFQILEGSHVPKSPEPVAPASPDNYHQTAFRQQQQQYELQQQHNQQKPAPETQSWRQYQGQEEKKQQSHPYFVNSWQGNAAVDDGQYREIDEDPNKPHNFGEGYAFSFHG